MRHSHLEITQFTILQALLRAGEITQGRLGIVLVLDSTTLSRSLAPLEKRGWIASRAGSDRRQRFVRVTPAGEKAMQSAARSWEAAQTVLHGSLGSDDWEQLMKLMTRVAQAVSV